MSKVCPNCVKLNSIVDEQKSKIQLLETRIKDLIRAYKVLSKEKDDLSSINFNISSDVDIKQQKRIGELEESMVNMSILCGKFELERKQEKERIKCLEIECDNLRSEMENRSRKQNDPNKAEHSKVNKQLQHETKNKSCQTDPQTIAIIKSDMPLLVDQITQTNDDRTEQNVTSRSKNETAVVAPIQRFSASDSEKSVFSEELNYEIDSPNNEHNTEQNNHQQYNNNNGTSLFYVNELARKEIELAEYRLRVREYECSLRELQWKYTNDKYRFQSRIADLELLNNSFIVSKTDYNSQLNNVNVAYIRNILPKLLETKDKTKKQTMINAVLSALNSIQS